MRTGVALIMVTCLASTAGCVSAGLEVSSVSRLRAGKPTSTRTIDADHRAVATCVLVGLRGAPPSALPLTYQYLGEKSGDVRRIVGVETVAGQGQVLSPRPIFDLRFEELATRTVTIEARTAVAGSPLDPGVRHVIDRCAWLEAAPAP